MTSTRYIIAALAAVLVALSASAAGTRNVRGEVVAIDQRVAGETGDVDRVRVRCDRGAEFQLELEAGAAAPLTLGDRVWARVGDANGNGEVYRVRAMRNLRTGEAYAPGTGAGAQDRQRLRDGSEGGNAWRHGPEGPGCCPGSGSGKGRGNGFGHGPGDGSGYGQGNGSGHGHGSGGGPGNGSGAGGSGALRGGNCPRT